MLSLILLGAVLCAVYGIGCCVRAEVSEPGGAMRWLRLFISAWRTDRHRVGRR